MHTPRHMNDETPLSAARRAAREATKPDVLLARLEEMERRLSVNEERITENAERIDALRGGPE